jgi:hypothetical protein
MPATEQYAPIQPLPGPDRDRLPRLLYVSPVMPSLTGNGVAMRAGAVLADRDLARAEASGRLDDALVRTFDRVYVCSERDRDRLAGRGSPDVRVLPNTVPVPGPLAQPPSDRRAGYPFCARFGSKVQPSQEQAMHGAGRLAKESVSPFHWCWSERWSQRAHGRARHSAPIC